jgi:RHS repeat-associated protein
MAAISAAGDHPAHSRSNVKKSISGTRRYESGTAIRMDYDQDGRLQKVYQASGSPTTTYAYNATTGRLSSIADPAGTTAFSLYDANGLLKEITDPFSNTKVIYTYDTAGRVTKRTDGGKICLTQTYETKTGRIDTRTIRGGGPTCNGSIHASLNLDYDLASNVTRRVETLTGNTFAGTYNYIYDEANRLRTVAGPAAFGSRTYDYDGGGNRTSVQVNANPAITTTYNAASLPVSSSDGTSYSHDPVGDLTAIDRSGGSNDWFFSYSSWTQLTKAERSPGSGDVTYTLDALDRVLSRASTGATSQYTYQGSGEVLARSVVAGSTTTYAHTPGGPLAQKVGNTKRYYLRDLHGDLVGWSDTNGGLQGTAMYDPWGELLSGTGDMATVPTNGAFRFQSDLTDSATGQVDMLARLYEPTLGRFLSRDVLFGDPMSPISLNLYAYGTDAPVTFTDPTGMLPVAGDGTRREQSDAELYSQRTSGRTWEQSWTESYESPPANPVSVVSRVEAGNRRTVLTDSSEREAETVLPGTMRGELAGFGIPGGDPIGDLLGAWAETPSKIQPYCAIAKKAYTIAKEIPKIPDHVETINEKVEEVVQDRPELCEVLGWPARQECLEAAYGW